GAYATQHLEELALIQQWNSERSRFVEFRAGFLSGDNVAGLLADRAADFAAGGFDALGRLLARQGGEGSCQNESQTVEGAGALHLFRMVELESGGAQALDQLAIARLAEELVNAL